MSVTTIVLADDHHIVRHGLQTLLETEADFRIIGQAGDGLTAVKLTERLKPDVLIVDLMMPGINGLEVTRQVCQRAPHTRIVMLSMHANEAYVLEALRCGASGYVLKDSSAADLLQAVRAVVTGQRYLSGPLTERAIAAYIYKAQDAVLDVYETLTTREREVLQLVAEGRTTAQIAAALAISPRTVETHRANLLHKLGVKTQADLIRFALRRGIVPLEE